MDEPEECGPPPHRSSGRARHRRTGMAAYRRKRLGHGHGRALGPWLRRHRHGPHRGLWWHRYVGWIDVAP